MSSMGCAAMPLEKDTHPALMKHEVQATPSEDDLPAVGEDHPLQWLMPTPPQSPRGPQALHMPFPAALPGAPGAWGCWAGGEPWAGGDGFSPKACSAAPAMQVSGQPLYHMPAMEPAVAFGAPDGTERPVWRRGRDAYKSLAGAREGEGDSNSTTASEDADSVCEFPAASMDIMTMYGDFGMMAADSSGMQQAAMVPAMTSPVASAYSAPNMPPRMAATSTYMTVPALMTMPAHSGMNWSSQESMPLQDAAMCPMPVEAASAHAHAHHGHHRLMPKRLGLALPVSQGIGADAMTGVAPASAVVAPSAAAMAPCVDPAGGLPFGMLHRFHEETVKMGALTPDRRQFTKEFFMGRLSVLTEDQVHWHGRLHYAVQFVGGELSSADGVGFILSPKLPCCKNIQRIVSIFANRTGRICVRAHAEVIRSGVGVRPLEIGDWVTVTVDLDMLTAEFAVWPACGGPPSRASLCFGSALDTLRAKVPALPKVPCGYFACVVKNVGVTLQLGS